MAKRYYKKLKYRVGEKVYTYQNPTVARSITMSRAGAYGDKYDHNQYKVSLKDKNGYTYSSNWINEKSISKRKLR